MPMLLCKNICMSKILVIGDIHHKWQRAEELINAGDCMIYLTEASSSSMILGSEIELEFLSRSKLMPSKMVLPL